MCLAAEWPEPPEGERAEVHPPQLPPDRPDGAGTAGPGQDSTG